MHLPSSLLSKDNIELMFQCLDINMSQSALCLIIEKRTNIKLTPVQVKFFRSKLLSQWVVGTSGERANASAADCLLHKLDNKAGVSYVVLFAEYNSDLSRYPKPRMRLQRKEKDDKPASSIIIQNSNLTDGEDSAEKMAHTIRSALRISGTTKILLALAFTTKEARCHFSMFPESSSCDVVFKTNTEKRPLFDFAGFTSSRQTFPYLWVYLPSRARWIFKWAFDHVLPTFWPRFVLERMQLMCMDEDPQCMAAFHLSKQRRNLSGEPSPLLNVKLRRCAFHKINRNLTNLAWFKNTKAHLPALGKIECVIISDWLYALTDKYETLAEAELSYSLLEEYVTTKAKYLTEDFRQKIVLFLKEKVYAVKEEIFHCYFMDTATFGARTSNCKSCSNTVSINHIL